MASHRESTDTGFIQFTHNTARKVPFCENFEAIVF